MQQMDSLGFNDNLHWMNLTHPNNNPQNLHNSAFQVRCNCHRELSNYLFSYVNAVKLLYHPIACESVPVNTVAAPVIFLMRHSMELGYKYTLRELHKLDCSTYDHKKYKTHKLSNLHNYLKPLALRVFETQAPSLIDDFNSDWKNTELGMQQFEALDAESFIFRYPFDNEGREFFAWDTGNINLKELKDVYDKAMLLLEHLIDVINPL
ncbi:MAG: hypothetical protein V1746_03675 [bacterium]